MLFGSPASWNPWTSHVFWTTSCPRSSSWPRSGFPSRRPSGDCTPLWRSWWHLRPSELLVDPWDLYRYFNQTIGIKFWFNDILHEDTVLRWCYISKCQKFSTEAFSVRRCKTMSSWIILKTFIVLTTASLSLDMPMVHRQLSTGGNGTRGFLSVFFSPIGTNKDGLFWFTSCFQNGHGPPDLNNDDTF